MEDNVKLTSEGIDRLRRIYQKYGNVLVAVSHYEKIKRYLGNHSKKLIKAFFDGEKECYLIEKEN